MMNLAPYAMVGLAILIGSPDMRRRSTAEAGGCHHLRAGANPRRTSWTFFLLRRKRL